MRSYRLFIETLALLLCCGAGTVYAGLNVLEGEHTVVYDIVNPRGVAFIPEYANEAFEQKIISQDEFSKRVRVTARMHPLRSSAPYPLPPASVPPSMSQYLQPEKDRQSADPAIVRTARSAAEGSRSAAEAANKVLSWIADNLSFDASITVPSDAASALRSGKAYCVGYSNLAVAMLRAIGIPARVAHGYLPPGYEWGFSKEYWGVKVNDGGFHAYLELFYPDSGWVFSDAEHSHNFVDPFHLILRIDGVTMPGSYAGGYLEVDKATFYTIFSDEDSTLKVDELPQPGTKRLGRRFGSRQHAALITGSVKDSQGRSVPKGRAVLWKDGRGTPVPFVNGRFAVTALTAGAYRVELKGPGLARSSREVVVEPGRTFRLDFSLEPGGVITGKVLDGAGRPLAGGDVFYREGRTSYGVPVGQDGIYRIEGLAPGAYSLSLMAGERSVSREARVVRGRETNVDFVVK